MSNTFIISDTHLSDVFGYDAEVGRLVWKLSPTPWINIGDFAGSERYDGYTEVEYKGVRYLSHRLIFALHHGYMPPLIDHIDRNSRNNRVENLRESNKRLNAYNTKLPTNNKSGHKGVSWDKVRGKWVVRFKHGEKYLWGGSYVDINDAIHRRKELELEYLGEVQ